MYENDKYRMSFFASHHTSKADYEKDVQKSFPIQRTFYGQVKIDCVKTM